MRMAFELDIIAKNFAKYSWERRSFPSRSQAQQVGHMTHTHKTEGTVVLITVLSLDGQERLHRSGLRL